MQMDNIPVTAKDTACSAEINTDPNEINFQKIRQLLAELHGDLCSIKRMIDLILAPTKKIRCKVRQ